MTTKLPALIAEHAERGVVVEGYSPFKTTDLHDPVLTRIAGNAAIDGFTLTPDEMAEIDMLGSRP